MENLDDLEKTCSRVLNEDRRRDWTNDTWLKIKIAMCRACVEQKRRLASIMDAGEGNYVKSILTTALGQGLQASIDREEEYQKEENHPEAAQMTDEWADQYGRRLIEPVLRAIENLRE